MTRFRAAYGDGPIQLLAGLASFAIAAYALARVFDELPDPLNFVVWFGGAILAHDLVLFPLYSLLGAIAGRAAGAEPDRLRVAVLNHLRVPALFSGLLLLVWFPLILRVNDGGYMRATGLSNDDVYLERWLLLSAILFVGSAIVFALRVRRLSGAATSRQT